MNIPDNRKISDEMLSAFLDAALAEHEMEQIRQQLLEDEQLTQRLADLALVDSLVAQHYQHIDQKPMPISVMQLLNDNDSSNVVTFPWWRRVQQQFQQHAAAVACIAVFAGYGLAQLNDKPQTTIATLNQDVMQLLNSAQSGNTYATAAQQLIPQLSFVNQQGDFCRHYTLRTSNLQSENIACRKQGEWLIEASLLTSLNPDAGQYQTASGGHPLDSILDLLMAGPALSLEAEQEYLTNIKESRGVK
ncbi:hypothetical protein GCM10010919_16290 [Alishewanella longhuensis]|uniref:Anti-sigma factor n=1 Tax=Alishewanella longhuensis TaxID=1091037 RepID=A0ABQ3KXJ1_9ALTE|nr:hypothetical protein [Alishewanella longhuensis]GHG67536.1 hypothetical protein GCM10010919_16290 [Alishewanella longhuensis]